MCLNQSRTLLAAGSSDFSIKVVSLDDNTQKSFKGHEAPVMGVTLDPKDEYMASSSCDGSVKIWKMVDQSVVKSLNLLPKFNDPSASKSLERLAWQSVSGKYLAIPVDKELKVYERDSWEVKFCLSSDECFEAISLVSWSSCGNFLASASIEGQIIIWNINTQSAVEIIKQENSSPLCNIVWHPSGKREIAYVDNQGQFGVCENVVPGSALTKNKISSIDANDAMVDSDNDSLVATKRLRVKSAWIDDEADDDDEDDEFKDIRKLKEQLAAPLDFPEDIDADTASEVSAARKTTVVHVPVTPTLQPAFQPGSTPSHLMHRFMVWNSIGIIRCHNDDELSSIEVEFHDTSTHHPLHLTNHFNHTMAALSSNAVLLACKGQDDLPSKMVCLHFGSWDSSKEWTVEMPPGEHIEAIAVGSTWAAVATSKLMVRILTITGIQRQVFSLPGPVVAMSGHLNQLVLTYHAGNPLPDEQALGVKVLDLAAGRQTVNDQRLTISKKSTLSWIGFSEEGTPTTADSMGVVRMLNRSFGNTWVPVLETKGQLKSKSDNYWVLGMEERTQQLRCVLCRGSSYPPTLPRPVLVLLPLKIPLCEMATDKGEKEESYLKSCLLSNHFTYCQKQGEDIEEEAEQQARTAQIQTIMRLFALACKTDREFRAAEYCELLPDQRSVSLAIKYAAGNRKMNLAQRLNDLAFQKAQEEAEEVCDDDEQLNWPPRRAQNTVSSVRRGSSRQREVNNDEDQMEVAHEDSDDERDMTGRRRGSEQDEVIKPNPLLRRSLPKPDHPTPSPSYSSCASQGRPNPFKVLSPSKRSMGACGKSFFQSVEDEKKTALATKAAKISPKSNSKARKSKQMTLQSKVGNQIKADRPDEKADRQTKKKNGFSLWLEENRDQIEEENPDIPDEDVVKIAMKTWKGLDSVEKKVWNEKAKGNAGETEEKKRKRENDENDAENSQSSEHDSMSKKIKSGGTVRSSRDLSGFSYSKN
ncbi:WD repeat and HMG-box DNA-binding protein 1 isoform X2 [Nematostella vectensis]|nr:WD repeat and HMG-box DNA-binding protein 1 isoform X2 [Nematostella vectensis]